MTEFNPTADYDALRDNLIAETAATNRLRANGLEIVAGMLLAYCEVLRGERTDLSGLGEWRIACQNLEQVMGVKVLDEDHYAALARAADAAEGR